MAVPPSNSKLMHDYKPRTRPEKGPAAKLRWFLLGLGAPLVGLALITGNGNDSDAAPIQSLTRETKTLPLPELSPTLLDHSMELEEPDTENGALTTLTIESGDSLDWLFKKHKLSRKDLANILTLPEAKKTLRLVKPGEEIQVRHDGSKILELRRPLSETLILVVSRHWRRIV